MSEKANTIGGLTGPLIGGVTRRFITSEGIMIGQVTLRRGDVVPEHAHRNEQLTFVVQGAMHFWVAMTPWA